MTCYSCDHGNCIVCIHKREKDKRDKEFGELKWFTFEEDEDEEDEKTNLSTKSFQEIKENCLDWARENIDIDSAYDLGFILETRDPEELRCLFSSYKFIGIIISRKGNESVIYEIGRASPFQIIQFAIDFPKFKQNFKSYLEIKDNGKSYEKIVNFFK